MFNIADVIAEAREWLCELAVSGCFQDDPDDLIEHFQSVSDACVIRYVEREFDGGWQAFVESR